jgi:hypothetical protein
MAPGVYSWSHLRYDYLTSKNDDNVKETEMRFYFKSNVELTEANAAYIEKYEDVVFACTRCGSENTHEVDELVPSGVHHKVCCEAGHVTGGMPPARFRNQSSL